jgi:hypothetical protein
MGARLQRKTKSWLRRLAPTSSSEKAMMSRRGFRGHFPQGVDGLADGAVLNELVIPPVRDGGAFTSVRGIQGIPQRDIHFTATFVRSYTQEFETLDRLRQQVETGKITLRVAEVYPPKKAADAHRRLEAAGTRGRLVIQF